MKCAVLDCSYRNNGKASECSFFGFPSDETLLKKWKSFCRRDNTYNPKTAHICMFHFTNDDFENSLKYSMGYSRKRALKRGAVPTIYKASDNAERLVGRENKQVVFMQLHDDVGGDYEANESIDVPVEDPSELAEGGIMLVRKKFQINPNTKNTKRMNNQRKPDLAQICRTCLYKAEQDQTAAPHEVDKDRSLLSIYEFLPLPVEWESTQQIVELLANIAPQLHIPKMVESMPQMICGRCLEQLRQAHQFQQMCLSADSHMQQLQLDYGAVEMKSIFPTAAQEKEVELVIADPMEAEHDAKHCIKLEVGAREVMQYSVVNSEIKTKADLYDMHHLQPDYDAVAVEMNSIFPTIAQEEQEAVLVVADPLEATNYLKLELGAGEVMQEFIANVEVETEANLNDNVHLETYSKPIVVESSSDETIETLTCRQSEKIQKEYKSSSPFKIKSEQDLRESSSSSSSCGSDMGYGEEFQTIKLPKKKPISEASYPYKCDDCACRYAKKESLIRHNKNMHDPNRYKCDLCDIKLKTKRTLANHYLKTHGVAYANATKDLSSKSLICDICDKICGTPYKLKLHKMYHTNDEKLHKCEHCEMRFVCADHMRRHMRTHTGEKPYKCKYCPRAFAQNNCLFKHLRSHLGDNVYRCELCPWSFCLSKELRRHLATHEADDDATRWANLQCLKEAEAKLIIKVTGSRKRRYSQEVVHQELS